jgi:hypothetical protein
VIPHYSRKGAEMFSRGETTGPDSYDVRDPVRTKFTNIRNDDVMTDVEMRARIAELGIPNTMKTGRVELPNHLTPDLKVDFAKVNRKHLWWVRRGREWRVA